MKNRREFLKFAGTALPGVYLLALNNSAFGQTSNKGGYFSIPPEAYSAKQLTLSTFESLVNENFSVSTNNKKAGTLKLIEAEKSAVQNQAANARSFEGFNLIFESNGKGTLNDGIYKISNPKTGETEMFISTVGRSGRRYQAVFAKLY